MCKISEIIAILILAVTGQAANADTLPTLLSGTSPGGSTFFNASFSDVAGGVRLDLSIGSGWNSNAQLDAFYFDACIYLSSRRFRHFHNRGGCPRFHLCRALRHNVPAEFRI